MHICYVMVIELHKKGEQTSGKTAGNIAGKPIYEHFLGDLSVNVNVYLREISGQSEGENMVVTCPLYIIIV